MIGYISLHRKLWDSFLFEDKPFNMSMAWVDLLLLVNYEPRTVLMDKKPVKIKRGQTITSLKKLSNRWGWSIGRTRRFIKNLENEGMVVSKVTNKWTYLTICKYEGYQKPWHADGQVIDTQTDRSRTNRRKWS